MDRTLAARCFDENFNRFRNDTEKFNLYTGLANMAAMIQTLLSKVENLEQEIEALKRAH
jgi:archaellum component FlaC